MLGERAQTFGSHQIPLCAVPNLRHLVPSCNSQQGRGLSSSASVGEMKNSAQLACSFPWSLDLLGLCTGSCSLQREPGLWAEASLSVLLRRWQDRSARAGKAGVEASACVGSPNLLGGCVLVSPRHYFLTQLCRGWEPLAQCPALGWPCPSESLVISSRRMKCYS